jgi:hypothetical protein
MWRQVSIVGPYYTQQFSPRQNHDGAEDHSHSPRRSVPLIQPAANVNIGSLFNQNQSLFPRQATFDPFTEPVHSAYSSWRRARASSTDISMPDYSKTHTRESTQVSEPMVTDRVEVQHRNIQMIGPYDTLCEALIPRVPDNTPANGERETSESSTAIAVALTALSDSNHDLPIKTTAKRAAEPSVSSVSIKAEIHAKVDTPLSSRAPSITNSVKGRKENLTESEHIEDVRLPSNGGSYHKIIQPVQPFQPPNHGANKRQRVVTPAAAKVIDDEDEPRSSPSVRKVSGMSGKQEKVEESENSVVERRVLSEISNY